MNTKWKNRLGIAMMALGLGVESAEAGCHKYSIWHYPWKQKCEIPHEARADSRVIAVSVSRQGIEIPLPSLEGMSWEGEADEEVRAHILIRAAMEGKE